MEAAVDGECFDAEVVAGPLRMPLHDGVKVDHFRGGKKLLHIVDGTDRREFPGKPLVTGGLELAVIENCTVLDSLRQVLPRCREDGLLMLRRGTVGEEGVKLGAVQLVYRPIPFNHAMKIDKIAFFIMLLKR